MSTIATIYYWNFKKIVTLALIVCLILFSTAGHSSLISICLLGFVLFLGKSIRLSKSLWYFNMVVIFVFLLFQIPVLNCPANYEAIQDDGTFTKWFYINA